MPVSEAQFSRLEQQVDEARHTGDRAGAQINMHEAVCAERYKQIQITSNAMFEKLRTMQQDFDKRLRIRDGLQILTILAVLFGPGVAADFVRKFLGL